MITFEYRGSYERENGIPFYNTDVTGPEEKPDGNLVAWGCRIQNLKGASFCF